jgi:inorganic pyrophosphatase
LKEVDAMSDVLDPGGVDASEVVIVVEIPRGGRAKFEIDPESGTIWLDRVLSTSTRYPAEYGFVLGSAAGDDDPLDAVVLLEEATVPGCHVRARPIGVLEMSDEHGVDPKLLCVATGDPTMGTLTDIDAVAPHILEEIEHFFRVYKQLEPKAHVETSGWRDAAAAQALVAECSRAYERLAERSDERNRDESAT